MIDTGKFRTIVRLAMESIESFESKGGVSTDKVVVDLHALGMEAIRLYAQFKVEEAKHVSAR